MTLPTQEELTIGRRLARRRFAKQSFYALMFFGCGIIVLGMSNDDIANRIVKLTGPIGIVLGAWVAVISAYMASSAYENKGPP